MSKRLFGIIALAGLVAGLFIFAPAEAVTDGACGGEYLVTVEADTGRGVGYCSDGTLDWLVPPNGDGTSECGSEYPAAVEVDDPRTPPADGVSYCSDGTISGINDYLPREAFVTDQKNDDLSYIYPGFVWSTAAPASVSFVPTLPSLDAVQLCASGDSSTLQVNIRDGAGSIIATSSIATTPPTNPSGWSDPPTPAFFGFGSAIALTPGSQYAIEAVPVSGNSSLASSPNGPLWFREGASHAAFAAAFGANNADHNRDGQTDALDLAEYLAPAAGC